MNKLHVITPVKDSIKTTERTVDSVMASVTAIPFAYTVYNDFSNDENTQKLTELSKKHNFQLIHLKDITSHPSPNYLLVLQKAQEKALSDKTHLIIIESDVIIEKNTIQQLYDCADMLENAGLVSAVTTDENGNINFPNLHARKYKKGIVSTRKRISFCCALLTCKLLSTLDFNALNPAKDWYDVIISHKALRTGFKNYMNTLCPVIHLPHSSRPWKLLKYSNPLKYYWLKYTKQLKKQTNKFEQ
ncbi:MAG: glycosyltransferase family 2 protein [Prevotellaceae bacterium]|jgi:hypothetical protein|nr:glycosyltransferase family 2 protein [Prevotellaceae bacterium]